MKLDPRSGLLFVISAPSGAGKTSLVNGLLDRDSNLVVSVSHTTRPKRPGEQDGADYHFINAAAFDAMVADHAFLEHAQVFGNRYGTARSAVEAQLKTGLDVVLEIDWQGARSVRQAYPAATSIFILPPSRAALSERLEGRAQDPPNIIEARTRQSREEMSHFHDSDYLIVNDDFDCTLNDLRCIIGAARLATRLRSQQLKSLLDELLADP